MFGVSVEAMLTRPTSAAATAANTGMRLVRAWIERLIAKRNAGSVASRPDGMKTLTDKRRAADTPPDDTYRASGCLLRRDPRQSCARRGLGRVGRLSRGAPRERERQRQRD